MKITEIISRRTTPLVRLAAAGAVILAAAGGGYAAWRAHNAEEVPGIPRAIKQQILFPAYLPTSLPAGLGIDPDSYQVEAGALLFTATNKAGDKVTFSEQAKPQDFDFASFNQKTLSRPRSLPDAPFTSILGSSEGDVPLLSVQTDSTWLIITSKAARADDYLVAIANSLQRQ